MTDGDSIASTAAADADVDLAQAGGHPRKRTPAACEACRATKLRCRPSEQPGVCRKCLDSKRECIIRAVARVRRPRSARPMRCEGASPSTASAATHSAPSSSAMSQTFSIDFEMPADPDVDEHYEALRDTHASLIDELFPPDPDASDVFLQPNPSPAANYLHSPPTTASTPSSRSQPLQQLHAKPSFNLASAESLLASFRPMLSHFPCIVLPPHATVSHLAATKPFVLLAILCAASGSRTLQGHSLYDEEFRKVLGLKFVAGGERSLELLQGMLIYCAWYPFYLRPKNKQAYHYLRMGGDLVGDLGLDQDPRSDDCLEPGVADELLDGIRAHLSYYCLVSAFSVSWRKYGITPLEYTHWMSTSCDLLQAHAQSQCDTILASMVRLTATNAEAVTTIHENMGQTEQQSRLVVMGLEAQLRELEARMPPYITCTAPIKMQTLFVRVYLQGGPVLKLTRSPQPLHLRRVRPAARPAPSLPPEPARLRSCVEAVRDFFSYVTSLDDPTLSNFSAPDWTRFVLAFVVAIRLSFPVPQCPDFDSSWARANMRFQETLDKFTTPRGHTALTPASSKVDVLSALQVVVRVIKEKYLRKLAIVQHSESVAAQSRGVGCPMLDGSLDQYLSVWDADFSPSAAMPSVAGGGGGGHNDRISGNPAIFHDLWATMTVGWASHDDGGDGPV